MSPDVLTAHQTTVMSHFLEAEALKRRHLVVSISGAHAYGFPSPDSDIDVKAVHLAPTEEFLGLRPASAAAERLEVIDGVEIDYSSNELGHVLKGVISGNGNFIERILGHLQPVQAPALESLRPLVSAVLSKELYRHYHGFARQQLKEWEKSELTSAKKLLYVLRTTLTGRHALETGHIETDLTKLAVTYGLGDLEALLQFKRQREKADLPSETAARWRTRVELLFADLERARARSVLPEHTPPQALGQLEAWLISLRVELLGGSLSPRHALQEQANHLVSSE